MRCDMHGSATYPVVPSNTGALQFRPAPITRLYLRAGWLLLLGLLGIEAHALDLQPKLFEQNFQSLQEIQEAGGQCTVDGSNCLPAVFAAGNGIAFPKDHSPVVSFAATRNGVRRIDPGKGTIVLDYVPLAPTEGGDWGSQTPQQKTFFHLRDPLLSTSIDQTLRFGTYYEPSNGLHYLFFRYDGTSGCAVSNPPPGTPSCHRSIATVTAEPQVVMKWTPGSPHTIAVTWDFTGSRPYLAMLIDGGLVTGGGRAFRGLGYPSPSVGLSGVLRRQHR